MKNKESKNSEELFNIFHQHDEHCNHHIDLNFSNDSGKFFISKKSRYIFISFFLNFVASIVQFMIGILSNSLAVISDSIHNLSDSAGLVISFYAEKKSHSKSNQQYTFGFKRIKSISALINSVLVLVVCFYIVKEAIERIINPLVIEFEFALYVTIFALIINISSALLLKSQSKNDFNIKSAYLHLVGDSLNSLLVIISLLIGKYFKLNYLDLITSMFIGIYLFRHAYKIIKYTVKILVQSSTSNINTNDLIEDILKIEDVKNVHHIHIWNLTEEEIHFECHIDLINDLLTSNSDNIRKEIEKVLVDKYKIHHTTIQIEYNTCDNKSIVAH